MDKNVIIIGIAIVIISIIIYFIKNSKEILDKVKENKLIKISSRIILIILLIIFTVFLYSQIRSLIKFVNWYKQSIENDKTNLKYDNMIIDEISFYNNAINKEYENQNPQNPYIPNGFEYVEGQWDNGFVIQDANKNQYVWVPCTNKDNEKIEKLKRRNVSTQAFISKDTCANLKYEDFITSALENGGFYISRFEIGKENGIAVSKPQQEIYSNLTIKEAENIADKMYENVNCEIINGYAYDTTIDWLMNTNNVQIEIYDNEQNIFTGRNSYNNIYDLFDNIMELTLENCYGTTIIRGYPYASQNNSEKFASQIGLDLERSSILKESNSFGNNILGFRTVIYK